jgi:hypothetical protein
VDSGKVCRVGDRQAKGSAGRRVVGVVGGADQLSRGTRGAAGRLEVGSRMCNR